MNILTRISLVIIGAAIAAMTAWAFLDAAAVRDQAVERRALEMRAAELNAHALAPGSALACLDALAGENIETACEKALFANPATVASATSYAAARLALLADMVVYGGRSVDIERAMLPLRRSLEIDRFGFVAHALAVRDGCTSQNCKALALLHDPNRVRANLSGATLDRYLERYLTVWNQSPDSPPPVADATASQPAATNQTAATSQSAAPGPHKVTVNIDFPSAASIPPVSILNPEPGKPPSGAAAAAAADPNSRAAAAPSSKRSRKQAGSSTAPAAPSGDAPADPVWGPGTAAPAAGPAATATPAGAAAAPINPPPAQPQASAGGAPRAQ